jgi:Putative transposase
MAELRPQSITLDRGVMIHAFSQNPNTYPKASGSGTRRSRLPLPITRTLLAILSSLEFIQRLAALVPRPRLHLIRFHGVLAPNAKLRLQIIPSAPVNANNTANKHRNASHHSAPARISWARLLKRVFAIDSEHCP